MRPYGTHTRTPLSGAVPGYSGSGRAKPPVEFILRYRTSGPRVSWAAHGDWSASHSDRGGQRINRAAQCERPRASCGGWAGPRVTLGHGASHRDWAGPRVHRGAQGYWGSLSVPWFSHIDSARRDWSACQSDCSRAGGEGHGCVGLDVLVYLSRGRGNSSGNNCGFHLK